jgi:hypothetical protein
VKTAELEELKSLLASPEPEPRPRQFELIYGEVLPIVQRMLIPAVWLPNPAPFKDPGPAAVRLEYESAGAA